MAQTSSYATAREPTLRSSLLCSLLQAKVWLVFLLGRAALMLHMAILP